MKEQRVQQVGAALAFGAYPNVIAAANARFNIVMESQRHNGVLVGCDTVACGERGIGRIFLPIVK